MEHAFNLSFVESDLGESFQGQHVFYIVSSRRAKPTQRDPITKTKQINK